jgi:hypothetical protein
MGFDKMIDFWTVLWRGGLLLSLFGWALWLRLVFRNLKEKGYI